MQDLLLTFWARTAYSSCRSPRSPRTYAAACALIAVLALAGCGRDSGGHSVSGAFRIDVSRQRFHYSGRPAAPKVRPELAGVHSRALAQFDKGLAAFDFSAYLSNVDSYSWHVSYILEALVSAYEGTGDRKYLARAAKDIDVVLAHRADKLGVKDEVRGRILPSWAKADKEGRMYCWLVNAGMIIAPISRWAYLVDRDPALRAEWGKKADEYQVAVVETLNAFEDDWREKANGAEGYYVFLQGAQHRQGQPPRELPFNGYNTFARAFVNLWLITGEPAFRVRAEKLANNFRRHIRTRKNAAVWPYWNMPPFSSGSVDISHGQLDADFAFQCHRARVVFSRKDMDLIVRAFHRSTVRSGQGRLLGWTHAIDGTGARLDFGKGSLDFWSRFGQIDPAVAKSLWEGMPLYRGKQAMSMAGLLLMGCTEFRFDPVLHAAPTR